MSMRDLFREADELTRRRFLARAGQGFLGLGAMPLFGAFGLRPQDQDEAFALQPASARSVIYIYLNGGMSHLDTFDPKPGSETQGPVTAIGSKADGIQVSQHFPLLAQQMDKVCVINSMKTTQGAHAQGRYYMHTSYELRGTIKHPSLGAWQVRMAGKDNPAIPAHVAIGGTQFTASSGFMESAYAPLPIDDPNAGLDNATRPRGVDDSRQSRRLERLAKMNEAFRSRHDNRDLRAQVESYEAALRLMESRDLAAFDIRQEPDSLRDAYGRDRFGQGCLLARRLVENRVRFVEVVSNGWDTHNENFEALEDKCPELDRGLSTLLADLDARGLLEETLVVVATEFGRTPRITEGRNGRDHYGKAFSCLLAGGGVKGGFRYGKTDARGEEVIENPVTPPDFNATIAHALGLPLDHIIYSPSGRPFTVAHKGRPITGVFA